MYIVSIRTPSRASPWVSCGGAGPRYPAWGILFRGCTRCESFVPPVLGFECGVQSVVRGSLGLAVTWSMCVRERKPPRRLQYMRCLFVWAFSLHAACQDPSCGGRKGRLRLCLSCFRGGVMCFMALRMLPHGEILENGVCSHSP